MDCRALFGQEEQKRADLLQRLKARFEKMRDDELEVMERLIRNAEMAEANLRAPREGEQAPGASERLALSPEPATTVPHPRDADTRWWFGTLGLVLIVLGSLGLVSVTGFRLLAVLVLGPLLLASGLMQLLMALFAERWRGMPLHLTAAVLDPVVGFLILMHPTSAVDDLMLVLAAFLLIGGVYRVVSSLVLRFPAWGWVLAAGVVTASLGLIVWKEGPFRGLWLAGLCVAIDLICQGVSWLILSSLIRGSPSMQDVARAKNA